LLKTLVIVEKEKLLLVTILFHPLKVDFATKLTQLRIYEEIFTHFFD